MASLLSIIGNASPPLVPESFNLADHVLAAGQIRPSHMALEIVAEDGVQARWSHGELAAAVCGADSFFRATMPAGSRILLRLGNDVNFPIAFLGAIRAGMIPVPVSAQLTANEIAQIVEDISPTLIVADPNLPLPSLAIATVAADTLPPCTGSPLPAAPTRAEDPAFIVFTSGSSGRPRAVVHAHRSILARKMMHRDWYDLRPDDRMLHAGAFNWTYTLGTGLMDPWSVGATALIPAPGTPPERLAHVAARHGATLLAAVPGVFRKILKAPVPIPTLRHALAAGESLLPALRTQWREAFGTDMHEALGMSEISTFISSSPGRPAPEGAVGFAQRGRRLAILDPDAPGRTLPRGEPGMLAVYRRDPGLFLGYWQQEEETAARYHGEWFLTGDLCSVDEIGAFRHHGRADDMMNAGGYRVFPSEVEAALAAAPAISEIAVRDVELKPGVRIIAAFCVAKPGAGTDPSPLVDLATKHLAPYKRPREYVFIEALPRLANGKIDRRALSALFHEYRQHPPAGS